jgi:CHAD domain-containing protein
MAEERRIFAVYTGATAPGASSGKLDAAMSLDWGLQLVGRKCLADVLRERRTVIAGDAEGIHRMRVAVRQLRSFLWAAKPWLPQSQYRWSSERLKGIGQQLSQSRNWDVIATTLVPAVAEIEPFEHALAPLIRTVDRKRRALLRGSIAAVRAERFTAEIMELTRWFETSGWRADNRASEVLGTAAAKMLGRCYRRVRRQSRRFETLSAAERHQLRISVKKLRYLAEFLADLFDPAAVGPFVRRTISVQEGLGAVNDLHSAHALIVELSDAAGGQDPAFDRAAGFVLGWHARTQSEDEPALRRHVKRLRRAEPFWE